MPGPCWKLENRNDWNTINQNESPAFPNLDSNN